MMHTRQRLSIGGVFRSDEKRRREFSKVHQLAVRTTSSNQHDRNRQDTRGMVRGRIPCSARIGTRRNF